jgi:hypothetical protein
MDLTGSIADVTVPLSVETLGSLATGPTGSSAIDGILYLATSLPNLVLSIIAGAGADLGSTMGGPMPL